MKFVVTLLVCLGVFVSSVRCIVGQTQTADQESVGERASLVQAMRSKITNAKRVVFLGDSNTNAGEYINQLEAMMLENYGSVPEMVNLGLSSETCCGLSEPTHPFPRPNVQERLVRALEKTKPDVLFACYGMNDGIYHPYSEERFEAFKAGIQKIIAAAGERNVPLVLMTPPPFDPMPMKKSGKLVPKSGPEFSWSKIYEKYDDDVIERYANWMVTIDQPNCLVLNVHAPFKAHLAELRKSNPEFAFSRDGVHFNNAGHKVLVQAIACGLGFEHKLTKNEALIKLVRQRHSISHPAWLSEVGHKRPKIKPGLPMDEAISKIQPVTAEIEKLVGASAKQNK